MMVRGPKRGADALLSQEMRCQQTLRYKVAPQRVNRQNGREGRGA